MTLGYVNRKQVTGEDVIKVRTLIEYCLRHFMNKEEVVQALQNEIEIEPDFTKLVWQKLEEENKEFFETYLKWMEEKKHLMALATVASHPVFDESHNHAVLSQLNSGFDRSYNHAVLSQSNSEFDRSHNHVVLSQPNSNEGLSSTIASLTIIDGLYNSPVLLEPNSNLGSARIGSLPTIDGSHNPSFLSEFNSNLGSTETGSLPSFHAPHNPATLALPNSSLGLTENGFAPLPTFSFDGSHNFAVFSQPDLEVSPIPNYPECYYTDWQIQSLMARNMQHPDNTNSSDLHTSMHGAAYDNSNWIDDPSSMFSNQGQDMSLVQGINGEMIESRPEYSGFVRVNGETSFFNQSYGFGSPLN